MRGKTVVPPERLQLLLAVTEALHGREAVGPTRIRELCGDAAGSQSTLSKACNRYREWREQLQEGESQAAEAANPLALVAHTRLQAVAEQFVDEILDVVGPAIAQDREQAESLQSEVERLRGELDTAQQTLAERDGELGQCREMLEHAQHAHAQAQEHAEVLERERDRLAGERDNQAGRADELAAKVERLESQLAEAQRARDTAAAHIADRDNTITELRERIAEADQERRKAIASATRADRRRERELRQAREAHEAEVARKSEEHQAATDAYKDQIHSLTQKFEATQSRALAAERDAVDARSEAEQARHQANEAERRHAEVSAAKEEADATIGQLREALERWQHAYLHLAGTGTDKPSHDSS